MTNKVLTLLIAITQIMAEEKQPSISSVVPFDYGISQFMAFIPEMGAPPPLRSGIVAVNTGINAKLFVQLTGLSLIHFNSGKKKNKLMSMSSQIETDFNETAKEFNFLEIPGTDEYKNWTGSRKNYLRFALKDPNYIKMKSKLRSYKDTVFKSVPEPSGKLTPFVPDYMPDNTQMTSQRKELFQRKTSKRIKRDVQVCFTILFFTFCQPDETELNKIKDAIRSLQGDVIKMQKFQDDQAKKTLLIANTMNKNFAKVNADIGHVEANVKALYDVVAALNQYAIKTHDEGIAHFYRLMAEELAIGLFPAALIGNFTDVKKFRDLICMNNEYKDACLWGNNPLPYGMKNLAYGDMDNNLWVVGAFNFIPRNFAALKVFSLPHEIGGTCFKVQMNYDRIVMSLDLKEIFWFDKDTVVMEWRDNKGPHVTECHRSLLMSTILGYKPYLNMVNWKFPDFKGITKEQEIVRFNELFIEKCTKKNSLLVILQDGCGITSPMSGLIWDPATRSFNFLGEVLFSATKVVDIPVILPDLPYKDFNGTGYIDTSEWEKQINDEVERQKRDNEKTKNKIDDIKSTRGNWGLSLGLGFGSFFFIGLIILVVCCLCKSPNPGSRFMFIVAISMMVSMGMGGETSFEKKTWFMSCAKLGDISNCPTNGTYYIETVKTNKAPDFFLAEVTKTTLICPETHVYNSGWIAGVAIALALLIASMLALITVVLYMRNSKMSTIGGVCYKVTFADEKDPFTMIVTFIKTQFIEKTSDLTIEGGQLCINSKPIAKLVENKLSGNHYNVVRIERITDSDYIKELRIKKMRENGKNPFMNRPKPTVKFRKTDDVEGEVLTDFDEDQ